MTKISVVCTCPPDEDELIEFLNAFSGFVEDDERSGFSLFLVDEIGVSENYTDRLLSILRDFPVKNSILNAKGCGQFYALFEVSKGIESGVVVTIDPDMGGNLSNIPEMLRLIESGRDLVFAVRATRADVPVLRRIVSRIFNSFLRAVFGVRPTDINTPMVMFSSRISSDLERFPSKAGHPKLYFSYILGDRYCEVPIVVAAKARGSSYTWAGLVRLALMQVGQAYRFSVYVRSSNH